ncbi:MAG: type II toxin-antitoxin system HicB family antitoxin [Ktedonobacterales bacterium]
MSTQQPIQHHHYSMLIAWSDEDHAYIVSFPEWQQAGYIVHTHGDTYAEAVEKGQDMLTFLIESALEDGEPLPAPRTFAKA